MIDVASLLQDKITWKICESVHLGMDSIYLYYADINNAGAEYLNGKENGIYKNFEMMTVTAYKFYLTDKVIDDYRRDVIPHLPSGWWALKQPWMEGLFYAQM